MTEHESWRVRGPRVVAALEQYGQPCTVNELTTLVDDGRQVHVSLMETLTTVGAVKRLPGHPRQYQAAPGAKIDWAFPDAQRFSQASITDLEQLARHGPVKGKRACRTVQNGRWSAWNRLEVLELIRRTRAEGRIVAIEIAPKGRELLRARGVDVPPAVSLARPSRAPVCALCGQPPSPFTGAIEEGADGAYHAVCRLQARYEAGEDIPGFAQPAQRESACSAPTTVGGRSYVMSHEQSAALTEEEAVEYLASRDEGDKQARLDATFQPGYWGPTEWGPTEEPTPDEVDVQALALSMLQQCAKIINRENDLAGEWKDMEARLARSVAEVEKLRFNLHETQTLRRNLHEVQQENAQLRQAVADERAERLKLRVDLERWVNGKLVDPDAVKLAVKAIRAGG